MLLSQGTNQPYLHLLPLSFYASPYVVTLSQVPRSLPPTREPYNNKFSVLSATLSDVVKLHVLLVLHS